MALSFYDPQSGAYKSSKVLIESKNPIAAQGETKSKGTKGNMATTQQDYACILGTNVWAVMKAEDRLAYSIDEFAAAVGLGVAEIRCAVSERHLAIRRTQSGRIVVTAEDGLEWLRNLPIAGN